MGMRPANSAILSRLLTKCEAGGNETALALIKATSPVAWRHVHLNGRCAFRDSGEPIDLDAIIEGRYRRSWARSRRMRAGRVLTHCVD